MSLQQPEDAVGHVLDAADLIADAEGREPEALLEAALSTENRVRESAKRAAEEVDPRPGELLAEALARVRDRGERDA